MENSHKESLENKLKEQVKAIEACQAFQRAQEDEIVILKDEIRELREEKSQLNRALGLKLDNMTSGLSCGQSAVLLRVVRESAKRLEKVVLTLEGKPELTPAQKMESAQLYPLPSTDEFRDALREGVVILEGSLTGSAISFKNWDDWRAAALAWIEKAGKLFAA